VSIGVDIAPVKCHAPRTFKLKGQTYLKRAEHVVNLANAIIQYL